MPEDQTSTKEVAKTAGKAIDAISRFGSFLNMVFGDSLVNVGEIAEQQTAYWKYKNALRIQDKIEAAIAARGIEGKTVHVAPRLGIPLLDAAVEEDNEQLQDLWSGLLVSAMDPKSAEDAKKSYIEILKQIDPLDAKILYVLFHVRFEEKSRMWMVTDWGKDEVSIGLAIRNLERLRLLKLDEEESEDNYKLMFGEIDDLDSTKLKSSFYFYVEITSLGWHFLKTCTNFQFKGEGGGDIFLVDWKWTTKKTKQ